MASVAYYYSFLIDMMSHEMNFFNNHTMDGGLFQQTSSFNVQPAVF